MPCKDCERYWKLATTPIRELTRRIDAATFHRWLDEHAWVRNYSTAYNDTAWIKGGHSILVPDGGALSYWKQFEYVSDAEGYAEPRLLAAELLGIEAPKAQEPDELRSEAEAALEAIYRWGMADMASAARPYTMCRDGHLTWHIWEDEPGDLVALTLEQANELMGTKTHEQRVQFIIGIMAAQEDASD